MTDKLDLDALQKLADEATPGPWTSAVEARGTGVYAAEGSVTICRHVVHESEGHPNAAFIAAARKAVPALIARVRELEAEIARLKERLDWASDPCAVRLREGHAPTCVNVRAPKALHRCDCGRIPRAEAALNPKPETR